MANETFRTRAGQTITKIESRFKGECAFCRVEYFVGDDIFLVHNKAVCVDCGFDMVPDGEEAMEE